MTKYLHEFEHVTKRVWDVEEEGISREVLEGAPIRVVLSFILRDLAHDYVLIDTKAIGPWIQ